MLKSKPFQSPQEIAITGFGLVTSAGVGIDDNFALLACPSQKSSHAEYKLTGFNASPYLSDRKVIKVVAPRDVVGLVAFETCVRDSGLSKELCNPEKTGLFVGAAPSSILDNANYIDAVQQSFNAYDELVEGDLGKNFRSAAPTTLLNGLPNNVLCYGSKTLDARGANSNYTAMETSSHLAVIGAARALRLARVDCAIAGGYSAHTDNVVVGCLNRQGLFKQPSSRGDSEKFVIEPQYTDQASSSPGTITSEGGAFLILETMTHAKARSAKILAKLVASGCSNKSSSPYGADDDDSALKDLITETLAKGNVKLGDIGIIALSGSGIIGIDRSESNAVATVFGSNHVSDRIPPCIAVSKHWGNLMEASGIGDVAVIAKIYEQGEIPIAIRQDLGRPTESLNLSRTYGLILRSSMSGEHTCLLVNYGAK